jgi:hypothetical protein
LCEGTCHKIYKREKANSNRVKSNIQRIAFKGTDASFAIKEYWHKKLQRQKSHVQNSPVFSFESGSRRPHFTYM